MTRVLRGLLPLDGLVERTLDLAEGLQSCDRMLAVIFSKAMLSAKYTAITQSTITSQIRR